MPPGQRSRFEILALRACACACNTMIVRSLAARSCTAPIRPSLPSLYTDVLPGPRARALASHASRPLRRFLSTDIAAIEASTDNSLKQVQSIEAQLNAHLQQPLPSINPASHAAPSSAHDDVAQQYHLYKQQGTPSSCPWPLLY
jgi:hypothetical protein